MAIIERQLEALTAKYSGASLTKNADGSVVITVPNVKLPTGWNSEATTVAFVAPAGYPQAAPDCFWTNPALALAHGGAPKNTAQNQGPGIPPGWRWFSWHPNKWNPNSDDFLTYLNVIRRRLEDIQ
jgi:hypothetical protein